MARRQATTEEIIGWLEDLNEDDNADIIDDIRNANSVHVTLFPPEEQEISDCDDADEDDEGTLGDLGRGVLKRPCEIKIGNSEVDNVQFFNDVSNSKTSRSVTSTQRKKKKPTIRRKWSKIVLKAREGTNTAIRVHTLDIIADILNNDLSPLQLFKLIFDDDFMKYIQAQTIKYAVSKGDEAFTLNLEELYTYLGILILSGYSKVVPATRMYWETESDVYNHLVAGSMARNKFEKIHRYLHFNDNTQIDENNKAFKVQPILDHLNTKFKELAKPFGTSFSVDESMEPYFGKHSFKQFIRGKPIRYGYKIWCLTTSEGYLLNFDLYTGKGVVRSNEPLGLSVTKNLCCGIVPENSTVFLDNYFNSFKLLEEFDSKNITVVGTIRSDRIENAPLSNMKGESRGACEAVKSKNITLVRWNDNNNVTIATNCKNDNITTTTGLCKRYNRQQKRRQDVKQPVIIKEYNCGMGGVDLFDQQRAAYRTRIRSRKWYWPIFRFCLNGAIVNLWMLFRKAYPKVTLLGFIRRLTRSILSKPIELHPVSARKRKRENETRYDGVEHYVNYSRTQRRCKFCGKCTKFICMKCNFGLHPDNCFYKYHVTDSSNN